jgi:heme a synthase
LSISVGVISVNSDAIHHGGENIWLHRFAILTSVATFCLIIAGGLVTSTGSGLAVPDWPLSYGQLMPPMVGGIFYEHGHRMVATFVGLLTTILAIWLWKKDERKWVRTLGLIALVAVMAQGVLGGLTVLFLLPTPISVAHATVAQSFFCLTIILALVTSPSWRTHQTVELESIVKTRQLMILTTVAIFVQLMLGALMRHTQSGLAIPDFPLSYGQFLPPVNAIDLPRINEIRLEYELPAVGLNQIWIHFAHRVGALLVAILIAANVTHVFKTFKTEAKMREPALVLLVLLLVQLFLGALTVWTGKGVEVATAHVATGALLLGVSVVLSVRAYHLFKPVDVHDALAVEAIRA